MRITKIDEQYDKLTIVLTDRYTTAVDMYKLMLKLNTEQETTGEFDILLDNIREICKDKEFEIFIFPEFYPGREDVIFELRIEMFIHKGSKLEVKQLFTEDIIGTLFKEIKEHFNFYYRGYPEDVSYEIVKQYFRGY
jgi:hypothetical protein